MTNHISNCQIAEEIIALWQVCVLTGSRLGVQMLGVGLCGVSGTGSNNIITFFFFKQKTAYEMIWWLEFRRVLFRSLYCPFLVAAAPRFFSCPILVAVAPPLFILPIFRCSSTPAFYTAHFSLRQRPSFYAARFSLRQRPLFLYLPILAAAAPRFSYCPFLVAAAPRFFLPDRKSVV